MKTSAWKNASWNRWFSGLEDTVSRLEREDKGLTYEQTEAQKEETQLTSDLKQVREKRAQAEEALNSAETGAGPADQ
ncbi:MAG: hypothetical protein U5K84_10190 [Alkalibacterium sp.]|nr:hypothetical protein [Alkalibacterium sp.]